MAEKATATTTLDETENPSAQDMELESSNGLEAANGESNPKREREEGAQSEDEKNGDGKKLKVDQSVEEQRLEKMGGSEGEEVDKEESVRVTIGSKTFGSSVEIFDYFYKFLHFWTPNVNVNKYEHSMLLELLKKGHLEPEKKIGLGVSAFQVRYHPEYKSRCFFLVRDDKSADDFSFRKCVDHILPLPESMQIKPDANKALRGGKHGGGRGGRGRGRGRGGHWRGGKSRN